MKFNQLANGARFEYQGKVYIKTGTMVATGEDGGGSRMIPRSAVLKPLAESSREISGPKSQQIRAGAVMVAFEGFRETCARLLDEVCPSDRREATRSAVDEAARRFWEALSQPAGGIGNGRGQGPPKRG